MTGRPRKFEGPTRAVTVTLPEDTIASLSRIDDDRSRAIVRATAMAFASAGGRERFVEIIQVGSDTGMLTVPRCDILLRVPELSLVEITPVRFLIVVASGAPLSLIEVRIADLLDTLGPEPSDERAVLDQLLEYLRRFRRADRVDTAEVILVKYPA